MEEQRKKSKTLNALLWFVQGLLALIFVWAGSMKICNPEGLPFIWVKDNPHLVMWTGIVDLLAGIGIVASTLVFRSSLLAVITAIGIIVLMIAASIFHISRGEASDIGFNAAVLIMASFIAWGRGKKH